MNFSLQQVVCKMHVKLITEAVNISVTINVVVKLHVVVYQDTGLLMMGNLASVRILYYKHLKNLNFAESIFVFITYYFWTFFSNILVKLGSHCAIKKLSPSRLNWCYKMSIMWIYHDNTLGGIGQYHAVGTRLRYPELLNNL